MFCESRATGATHLQYLCCRPAVGDACSPAGASARRKLGVDVVRAARLGLLSLSRATSGTVVVKL